MAPEIVAIVGSPRKRGNTQTLAETALQAAKEEGCKVRLVPLRGRKIKGCLACGKCFEKEDGKCHGAKDDVQSIIDIIMSADGVILCSPTYFGSCSPELKAVMDRTGMVSKANGEKLSGKAGGPIVVARRAGAMTTYSQIAMFYPINGMILVGSTYWNVGFGRDKGEVNSDDEAIDTVREFGRNLAKLLNKIKA